MAATTAPLVWDYYRQTSDSEELGGVAHYFDESSQSIYLQNGGITTKVAAIYEGHWNDASQSDAYSVTDDDFTKLRLDHPSNGILYGVATDGDSLTFLRYVYGMQVAEITDSWSWLMQSDNPIAQFDSEVQNIDAGIFAEEVTLFQPGAKLTLDIYMGDSDPYPIGVAWLDESGYDQLATTVKITGRNTIGYYLKDQTFDDKTKFSGTTTAVIKEILEYAGLVNFVIQDLSTTKEFEFKPSDSLLSGIEEILKFYTTVDSKMEIIELPDGTVCVGFDYWISTYIPRGYYSFDEGREVFKRNTTRAADGAYTAVRVTGRDADNNELTPVTVEVENFRYWYLGKHRTKHLTAPDGLTQAGLQNWAEAQAKVFQYVGIGEDFTAPFRPHLVVGDIAEVVRNRTGVGLGIVTEVKQVFTRQNGYLTEFSVDSGGVATNGDEYKVYSQTASVHGYNRRQSIIDLVKYTAEKAGDVENLTPEDIGALDRDGVTEILNNHNLSGTAHQDIRQKLDTMTPMPSKAYVGQYLRVLTVDANGKVLTTEAVSAATTAPFYDLLILGLSPIPTDGTPVSLTTDVTEMRSSLSNGPVKYAFQLALSENVDVTAVIMPVYIALISSYQTKFQVQYNDVIYEVEFTVDTTTITASATIVE